VGFAEGLRLELRHVGAYGVGSSLICPAHIKTELFKGFQQHPMVSSLTPREMGENILKCVEESVPVMVMVLPSPCALDCTFALHTLSAEGLLVREQVLVLR
jgi:short-subunit dehydrogenase